MKTSIFWLLFVAFSSISGSVFAEPRSQVEDDYFTLSSVKVRSSNSDRVLELRPQLPKPDAGAPAGSAGIDIDDIINLGKELWTIVSNNRPVSEVRTEVAHALPKAAKEVSDLEFWKGPRVVEYEAVYENKLGIEVIHFTYAVMFDYGGIYLGGGRYLANVTVIPRTVSVKWGYTFNAETKVLKPTNAGSKKDPLAALQIVLNWKVDTVVQHQESTMSYQVRGDGAILDL